jgi:hypothetical protein
MAQTIKPRKTRISFGQSNVTEKFNIRSRFDRRRQKALNDKILGKSIGVKNSKWVIQDQLFEVSKASSQKKNTRSKSQNSTSAILIQKSNSNRKALLTQSLRIKLEKDSDPQKVATALEMTLVQYFDQSGWAIFKANSIEEILESKDKAETHPDILKSSFEIIDHQVEAI